jgi:hypothetical protein
MLRMMPPPASASNCEQRSLPRSEYYLGTAAPPGGAGWIDAVTGARRLAEGAYLGVSCWRPGTAPCLRAARPSALSTIAVTLIFIKRDDPFFLDGESSNEVPHGRASAILGRLLL